MHISKNSMKEFLLILIGSFLYAVSTTLFIFPHALLLGGTSGISVILESFLHISPGTILMVINSLLIVVAFLLLGRKMGIKTLIGSVLTTFLICILEQILVLDSPVFANCYLSAAIGGGIAVAVMAGIIVFLCVRADQKVKTEYALSGKK